jgi:propanol-preferring alcohol dehydrogenase
VAAIAADAGVTSYRAVQRAAQVNSQRSRSRTLADISIQVKPGDKVLIFGIGGLGHLALQYAKHFGATGMAILFSDGDSDLFGI